VADEPVVVLKSQPVKLGNNVEDKTEMTTGISSGYIIVKSYNNMRRGEVVNKSSQEE